MIQARVDLGSHQAGTGYHEVDNVSMHDVRSDEVVLNIIVAEDVTEGTYRISCTRVAGDALAFHSVLRLLRDTIGFCGMTRTGFKDHTPQSPPGPWTRVCPAMCPRGIVKGQKVLKAAGGCGSVRPHAEVVIQVDDVVGARPCATS